MENTVQTSSVEERQAFYNRIDGLNLAPLWEVLKDVVPPEPKSQADPAIWRYADVRPYLMECGGLLTAKEAERRVLVFENPALRGKTRATATLFAGIQLILPGETAPAHRHTPSALRFMIEGEHGFTAVGGERTTMREGDLVITPAWAWHDHGNEGTEPVAWLDGLDIPIVRFFESVFMEGYNDERHQLTRPEGDALARFGEGLMPIGAASPYGQTSPIFNYPYDRTRAALLAAAQGADPDPHIAHTLRYTNPIDGGWAMPTLSTWITYLPSGTETKALRSTDSIVMHVVEGSGSIQLGDTTFGFAKKDTVAIPGWTWRSIKASEDVIAFFYSDRVIHEKLGFFREEKR